MTTTARQYIPPIKGVIETSRGKYVQFQFVSAGQPVPYAVLSNHGLQESQHSWEWQGHPVRFRFLIMPGGPDNRWRRSDLAEPHVDFSDSLDAAPDQLRTLVHDDCLDAWEAYMDERPELVTYARIAEVNNDIVQIDEKLAHAQSNVDRLMGEKANLEKLEKRLKDLTQDSELSLTPTEYGVLVQLAKDNCWLSVRNEDEGEIHPYMSTQVSGVVDPKTTKRLVLCGYVQLHRHLEAGRNAFRISERGHQAVEKHANG